MAEEGTKDVSTGLEKRTDVQFSDQILMVNPVTQEVQYLEVKDVGDKLTNPTPSDETFIII